MSSKLYYKMYVRKNHERLREYKTRWQAMKRFEEKFDKETARATFMKKYPKFRGEGFHTQSLKRVEARREKISTALEMYFQKKMYLQFKRLFKLDQLLELYKIGQTTVEIAKKYGVTTQYISMSLRGYQPLYRELYGKKTEKQEIKGKCQNCKKIFFYFNKGSKRKFCDRKCFGESMRLFDEAILKLPKDLYRKYNRERKRKYYQTDSGNKIIKRISKKSYFKFKDKSNARALLNQAVKKGILKKPKYCSVCKRADVPRICAHHPDYTKPLKVMWLCDVCHNKEHKKWR